MAQARQPPNELITLQEAAERLSVHYMTAYRWVRRGELPAFKTGGRLRIRVADLEHFLSERELDVAMQSRDGAGQTDWQRHVDRLVAALLVGDAAQATNDVRKVLSDGATAGDVYVWLIAPALQRIGQAWSNGQIGTAEKHRASQICITIVAQLSELFRRRRAHRGTAVTLTSPDEHHAVTSAMTADLLRAAGYEVHHLGSGVPPADLAAFLQSVSADLVCFSISIPVPAKVYVQLMQACQQGRTKPLVIFGGAGVDGQAARGVGAAAVFNGIGELADLLESLATG